MSNIVYSKKTFIRENSNFITDEICNDIIEIYEEEKIDSEIYNMDICKKYKKIKRFLTSELQKNIYEYNKKINILPGYNLLHFENISKLEFTFYIQKNNKKEVNITKRFSEKRIKLLMFIIFLNEYDGEVTFCNEFKIVPKVGKLVIFPVSWCFPYHELINLEANKYIIYGYIYW